MKPSPSLNREVLRWWLKQWRSPLWWQMPLIGFAIGAPISISSALYLAAYGSAAGPYGSFWFLTGLGLAVSAPVFVVGGFFIAAPLEIWLTHRPHRPPVLKAGLLRSALYAAYALVGAFIAHVVVRYYLPVSPPPTLLPVLLVTYTGSGIVIGIGYTFYDEYIHQLQRSARMSEELQVARAIQQGLFPKAVPEIAGFEMDARSLPAQETGGDFYDFAPLPGGQMGIVIGDVSGKGVPAALLMADVRGIWRAEAWTNSDPAEVLTHVNYWLCRDIRSHDFVTMIYAILDPDQKKLWIASAGHPPPLLRRAEGTLQEVEAYGLPLGIRPDVTYEQVQVALAPGDMLIFYTDGIVEALKPGTRQFFGFHRLEQLIVQQAPPSPHQLIEEIIQAIYRFSGDRAWNDDVTIVVLQRKP
ncbi:MAG: hypothetical protein D6759_13775 [Chloroflexi bacterium]|nr:MAG: hypothetical protein D6759_13775 [Chloroflexota bacterium]